MASYGTEHLSNFELAGTFECEDCGAVVRDTVKHDQFHYALDIVMNILESHQNRLEVLEK